MDLKETSKFLVRLFDYEIEPDTLISLNFTSRAKYLTKEERKRFSRKKIYITKLLDRNINSVLEQVTYFEKLKTTLLSDNGEAIPEKSFTTYIGINPCSAFKGTQAFLDFVNNKNKDLLFSRKSEEGTNQILKSYKTIPSKLTGTIAHTFSEKVWIDIDIDTDFKEEFLTTLLPVAKEIKGCILIESQGGFHLLYKPKILRKDPKILIQLLSGSGLTKEVEVNNNFAVPLVGTYQNGFLVRTLN